MSEEIKEGVEKENQNGPYLCETTIRSLVHPAVEKILIAVLKTLPSQQVGIFMSIYVYGKGSGRGSLRQLFLNWVSREEKERGNTDSPRQFFYDWGLDRMKNMCEREKEGSIDRV